MPSRKQRVAYSSSSYKRYAFIYYTFHVQVTLEQLGLKALTFLTVKNLLQTCKLPIVELTLEQGGFQLCGPTELRRSIQKNSSYDWTHIIHTHVVQETTVYTYIHTLYIFHIYGSILRNLNINENDLILATLTFLHLLQGTISLKIKFRL